MTTFEVDNVKNSRHHDTNFVRNSANTDSFCLMPGTFENATLLESGHSQTWSRSWRRQTSDTPMGATATHCELGGLHAVMTSVSKPVANFINIYLFFKVRIKGRYFRNKTNNKCLETTYHRPTSVTSFNFLEEKLTDGETSSFVFIFK